MVFENITNFLTWSGGFLTTKNDTCIPWSSWWKLLMWYAITERVKQKKKKKNHSKVAKNLKRQSLSSLVNVFDSIFLIQSVFSVYCGCLE